MFILHRLTNAKAWSKTMSKIWRRQTGRRTQGEGHGRQTRAYLIWPREAYCKKCSSLLLWMTCFQWQRTSFACLQLSLAEIKGMYGAVYPNVIVTPETLHGPFHRGLSLRRAFPRTSASCPTTPWSVERTPGALSLQGEWGISNSPQLFKHGAIYFPSSPIITFLWMNAVLWDKVEELCSG